MPAVNFNGKWRRDPAAAVPLYWGTIRHCLYNVPIFAEKDDTPTLMFFISEGKPVPYGGSKKVNCALMIDMKENNVVGSSIKGRRLVHEEQPDKCC